MIWFTLAKLAIEANGVIASRVTLMTTGAITAAEAQLMVTEKVFAAAEAGVVLTTGGSMDRVVRGYRRRIKANARRLSGSRAARS